MTDHSPEEGHVSTFYSAGPNYRHSTYLLSWSNMGGHHSLTGGPAGGGLPIANRNHELDQRYNTIGIAAAVERLVHRAIIGLI
jgi:hypothetical protein